jgi:DNA-binding transcriptional ArsR family regulator
MYTNTSKQNSALRSVQIGCRVNKTIRFIPQDITQDVIMKGLEDQDGLSEKIGEPALEPDRMEQDSRVLVLPVNGESRKITQILSNGTSLKILELLGEKGMSATDIAEKLNLPLTTVKYNLDSLIESDLIKVKQIKWSQKGRQVKIYESAEKLIVLVPSKSSIDRLSIMSILQKYIGVIGAAFFASAGIEYFSAYMQAKRIFDITAPFRTAKTESTGASPSAAVVMETNQSDNISTKSALDQHIPENGTMNPGYETMKTGTGNVSSGVESGPTNGATTFHAPVPASARVPNATGTVHNPVSNPTSIPPESLAHAGGGHGLYDTLYLHPGIWFLFGCIFIVSLLIVREIYYKKRAK